MAPQPVVTGVSPKDGTPGTRITIRGENLGTGKSDLLGVFICNINCTLTAEWMSTSKIVCRTGCGLGKGPIIVVTKSGGKGSCTVSFMGLPAKKVGPLEVSAVWVDETDYVDQRLERNQKITPLSLRSDPLGLNSDHSVYKAPSSMNLAEMYPDGSPDPTDENFLPAWFLIQRHFSTSFKQLKDGHAYMKRRTNKTTSNTPLNHVKDSLPVFFEVQEMLSSIHQRMIKDESGRNNENITASLDAVLQDASVKAGTLFASVLRCKDRADSIRSTLGVLQRFRFLFFLPLNIERNIQKGDYGIVINDYEKAKSLFADTEIDVFRQVYDEVETRIMRFRMKLRSELLELPAPLAKQKSTIRYLLELQEKGDPAWDCLSNQHEWIQDQLLRCKDRYLAKAKENEEGENETASSFQDFLEELSQLAQTQIPEHWHLWEQYATGIILSETGEKSRDVERLKESAAKHNKQMKGLLRDTIILFANLVRAAFLPATIKVNESDPEEVQERSLYGMWPIVCIPARMSAKCVQIIRSTLSALSQIKCPDGTMQSLRDLIHDMRVLSLTSFMHETQDAIAELHHTEAWDVCQSGITSLPTSFMDIVKDAVDTLAEVVAFQDGEEEIFTREAVKNSSSDLVMALFTAYLTCLERLAMSDDDKDQEVQPKPAFEKRIVIVLSNLHYTLSQSIETVILLFKRLNFPKLQDTLLAAKAAFQDLDGRLFDMYLERRVEPLSSALEPGMYNGDFSWTECLRPTGVRPYVKVAVTGIITMHAEIYTVCPSLVDRIMQAAVKLLSDEMLRLICCVQKFSANGSLQARLELLALRDSTMIYATDESNQAFDEACTSLPQLVSGAEKKLLEDLLNQFKSGMLFHQKCLQISTQKF